LEQLGVELSLRLVVDAPGGTLTPEIKAALGTHKNTLLALLAGVEPGPHLLRTVPALPPWPPRPDELADWPIPWRERWGRLANALEARGMPWPQCEAEAFEQVKVEMRVGAATVQAGLAIDLPNGDRQSMT
jgi:hypothetical protein